MMVESQGRMLPELDPDQPTEHLNEGEEHVLMGERQGSRNGRTYKKANWQVSSYSCYLFKHWASHVELDLLIAPC